MKEHNITGTSATNEDTTNETSSSFSYQHPDASVCTKPTLYLPVVFSEVSWNVLYWTSFIMCWAVYPIMQSYSTSGEFTIRGKLKGSIVENIWFYVIMGVVALVFLIIYIIVSHSLNLISLCMALANAWGLCLVILTLGYGIVAIPKKVWRRSSVRSRLPKYYFDVGKARSKLDDAREDLLKTLRTLKSYDMYLDATDPFRKYVAAIIAEDPTGYDSPSVTCSTNDPKLEYDELVSLHYNVMFYNHEYNLCYEYKQTNKQTSPLTSEHYIVILHYFQNNIIDSLCFSLYVKAVKDALDAEDIIKCMDNGNSEIAWTAKKPRPPGLISWLQWLWYCKLRNPLLKVLTVILALLSIAVLWSECIFSVDKPVMSIFALMISPDAVSSNDVYVTLTLFVPLLYVIVCSYWSLFQFHIFRYYRLISGQHSDANSLLFSAAYLSRIAAPLALNFIHVLKLEGTTFQKVMSSMEKIPIIGKALFNEYAPIALVIVCAFFLFNVPGRILWCCECSKHYYHDPGLNDAEIEYGKVIVSDERNLWANGVRRDTLLEEFGDPETGRLAPQRERETVATPNYIIKIFGHARPKEETRGNGSGNGSGNGNSGSHTDNEEGDKFQLSEHGSIKYHTFSKYKAKKMAYNPLNNSDGSDEENMAEYTTPSTSARTSKRWGSGNSNGCDNSSSVAPDKKSTTFTKANGWKKVT